MSKASTSTSNINADSVDLDADPRLLMPMIIQYDRWRNHEANEVFPEPPRSLLEGPESFPEPTPDYDSAFNKNHSTGIIPPHKLPNPVLESKDRVKLNSEIKWNAKIGINVLDAKPELQKELERRKLEKEKKEAAELQRSQKNEVERRLEQQLEKMKENDIKLSEKATTKSELERGYEKIKSRSGELPHVAKASQ